MLCGLAVPSAQKKKTLSTLVMAGGLPITSTCRISIRRDGTPGFLLSARGVALGPPGERLSGSESNGGWRDGAVSPMRGGAGEGQGWLLA